MAIPCVQMWTDGSVKGGNPGQGGWAVVLLHESRIRVVGGFMGLVSNNVAEMTAPMKGLQLLKRPCRVTIWTDSNYVVYGIVRVIRKRPLLETNRKHWEEFKEVYEQSDHTILLEKTDGHADDEINNLADLIAGYCAENKVSYDEYFDTIYDAISKAPEVKKGKKKK